MGHSPLLGTEPAPEEPAGRDSGALGPSDTSDSGSDSVGVGDGGGAGLPLEETLQEAEQPSIPADIDADRVVAPHRDAADPDEAGRRGDDEDPDLAFIDRAQAGDPLEDEDTEAAAPAQPPRPNPEPDAPAPTEPADPDAPPAEPEDTEDRKPGRTAALFRPRQP